MEYFGTKSVGDESALTVDERLRRCFELAGYALTIGDAPSDAILIHGTWQHIVHAERRIAHAWLELPDGQIWEPIQGNIWHRRAWIALLQPQEERRYTRAEARRLVALHHHWGRWHESEYE